MQIAELNRKCNHLAPAHSRGGDPRLHELFLEALPRWICRQKSADRASPGEVRSSQGNYVRGVYLRVKHPCLSSPENAEAQVCTALTSVTGSGLGRSDSPVVSWGQSQTSRQRITGKEEEKKQNRRALNLLRVSEM